MIDWGLATRIAGFGFLIVFAVLGILSVTLWLASLVLRKITGKRERAK